MNPSSFPTTSDLQSSIGFETLAYRHGVLRLLDQTKLPVETAYVDAQTVEDVARAIETLLVRGAPAIGLAAAFGMAIAARTKTPFPEADARLRRTRPTAVNLFWALDRMRGVWSSDPQCPVDPERLEQEAQAMFDEEVAASLRMGELGAELIPDGARILTHCNAGALATARFGTALAVVRAAHAAGKRIKVYADETRPVLQGARLTMWELMRDGIDVTLVADGAAAHLLGRDMVDCAITGADRIARNGDAANKIGTRGVACLFRAHDRPFYVVAPWTTVDLSLASGDEIEIEERSSDELTMFGGRQTAPDNAKAYNPAFDVTPAHWISDLITDRGRTGRDIAAGLDILSRKR
ncbi:MAG: S-methyl-5-thioribose-1-phosphate isomerase [Deltaproteobacteria bacterium]|nr:S-methyl-5-thioribose-1-phosphate isomerase [Deltaproteobacteria bacterium]